MELKRVGIFIIFPLIISQTVPAQISDSLRSETLHFYVNGQVALPSEQFRSAINNSIDNLGLGINIGLVMSPMGGKRPSPIMLGIDFGYSNYGVDKTPGTSSLPPLKTTYNIISWNGILRLRPPIHRSSITPFADGLVGVKILNTITKIDKDVSNIILNTNQPQVLNRINNAGLNFGAGVGFAAYSKKTEWVAFTMRFLYLWGDDIKYVVRHSMVVDNNGFITYKTETANTSIFLVQIGFNLAMIRSVGPRRF